MYNSNFQATQLENLKMSSVFLKASNLQNERECFVWKWFVVVVDVEKYIYDKKCGVKNKMVL